jgi:hypothetical protein
MRIPYLSGGETMVFFSQIRAGLTAFDHRQTLSTLNTRGRFKIAAKVLTGDYKGINLTVRRLRQASEAVAAAGNALLNEGKPVTRDLNGFRQLLFTARERVGGGDCKFSLALFDAAWKATIGDKEIGGLLKVADGAEKSVDGAALRREFRGYIRHHQWERIEWFSTMQDARSLPKVGGDKLINEDLLKFGQKHLQLLTSEEFWKSTMVNTYYGEYFSVLASTAALSDIRL